MALTWLPAVEMFNQYLNKYTQEVEKTRKMNSATYLTDKYSKEIQNVKSEEELGKLSMNMIAETNSFQVPEVANNIQPMVNIQSNIIRQYDEKKNAEQVYKSIMEGRGDEQFSYKNKITSLKDMDADLQKTISNPMTRLKMLEGYMTSGALKQENGLSYNADLSHISVSTDMKDATGKIYNRSAKEVKILPNGNIQYIDGTEVDAVSKEKISELLAGDRFRKQQLARMNSGRSSERDMTKNLYVKEENGSIKRNPDELNLPYNYQIGTNKQGQMIFLEGSDKGKLVPNPEKYKKVTKYNANAYFSPEAYLNTTIVNTMSGFDKIFLDKPELIKDWNEKIKSPKDLDLAVRGEFPKMFETYNLFNNIKDGSTKDLYSEITSLYPDLPISSVYQQTNVSGDPIVTIVEDKEVTKDDESFVKKLSTSMSPRDAAAYIEWLKRGKDKKAKGIQGRESWESYKNILMSSDAMYNLEKDGVSIGK